MVAVNRSASPSIARVDSLLAALCHPDAIKVMQQQQLLLLLLLLLQLQLQRLGSVVEQWRGVLIGCWTHGCGAVNDYSAAGSWTMSRFVCRR